MTETTTAQTMAVLAELVLMATRHNLPMPLYLTASEKNSQLNLTLNNRADLDAWHAVFGGGRLWECEPTEAMPSVLVTNMHGGSLLGWSVNLQASIQPPISPEVLAALGEAARSDAATLVAEAVAVLDEPKARRWRDRDGQFWSVGDDELISLETERGPSRLFVLATVEELAELYGPLVEVTP
ncbi:hypothetical protein [Roseateles sp.]|uniref:hypothetical protein n=1 Tax=Roseateles sp. TaxID=1971397 RepID=UPI002F427AB9